MRYQIYSLDVWVGYEENSWNRNNWFKEGVLDIPSEMEDNEILQLLIDEGYLQKESLIECGLEAYCDRWINVIRLSDSYPIYDLELLED